MPIIPTPTNLIPPPMWPCASGTDCGAHDDMAMMMLFGPDELFYSPGLIRGEQLDEDTVRDVVVVEPGFYCDGCGDHLGIELHLHLTLRAALRSLVWSPDRDGDRTALAHARRLLIPDRD